MHSPDHFRDYSAACNLIELISDIKTLTLHCITTEMIK